MLTYVPIKGHSIPMANKGKWLDVYIYEPARKELLKWPIAVKKDLGSILTKLQKLEPVGLPDIDSMRSVSPGCSEVRLKDSTGIYRAFFVIETEYGILLFHSFKKKTQKTPQKEIDTAKKRLKAFLEELENEKN